MDAQRESLWRRIVDRVFPKTPDFFALLAEQAGMVVHSVGLLARYMEHGDREAGEAVKADEHEADVLKVRNLHLLNEAFSTPIDREDLYRAITHLDHVVNYCKSTVNEMDALELTPDEFTRKMAAELHAGSQFLRDGYAVLHENPVEAEACADRARKAERKVEKLYRKALVELFQGEDYLHMLKRREIYRHLSNAADRLADAANTLHDIVVKIS
ncbi:DUF47 domain-containing protein [Endothiovibrio diazotrophicus]